MAEPNTIRRPQKPTPTYIGPVTEAGSQYGFHFYQPALNPNAAIWFAQATKSLATSLRNKLGKQPRAFLVSAELLDAIKESVSQAQHA